MNILKDFQTKNSMTEKCKDVSIFGCNCNGPECRSNAFSIIVIRFARLLCPNLVKMAKISQNQIRLLMLIVVDIKMAMCMHDITV